MDWALRGVGNRAKGGSYMALFREGSVTKTSAEYVEAHIACLGKDRQTTWTGKETIHASVGETEPNFYEMTSSAGSKPWTVREQTFRAAKKHGQQTRFQKKSEVIQENRFSDAISKSELFLHVMINKMDSAMRRQAAQIDHHHRFLRK